MRKTLLLGAALIAGALASTAMSTAAMAQERISVWFTRGFYPAEDRALNELAQRFTQRTGVQVDISLFSPEDVVTRSVAAVEAGNPPDVGFGVTYDFRTTGKWAFEGRLEDISDIIRSLQDQWLPGPLSTTMLLNGRTNTRAYYAAPVQMQLMHVNYWIDMVQAAGAQESDIPNSWNEFWNFWCDRVQGGLRRQGQRVFGIGHPSSVQASDTFYSFHKYMLAYNVQVVDDNGNLTLDQGTNRTGFINAVRDYANIVSRGCSPASAVNWTDVDNNLNFANRTTVMTHNATISIPAAQLDASTRQDLTAEQRANALRNYRERIRTRSFPNRVDGRPMPQLAAVKTAVIFADARNKARGREFLRFFLEEANLQPYVEGSLGRWIPVTRNAINAPFWTSGDDPHRAAVRRQLEQGLEFFPFTRNWRFTVVNTENVWGRAVARVARDGLTPEAAADEAIARIRTILSQN